MLELLLGRVTDVRVTDTPSAPPHRRWNLAAVEAAFAGRVAVEPDLDAALAALAPTTGTVLVCGSFHTVGDAMARLPGFPPLG
jgi:dihydrofolate synthase/folylpolyglutamate synthase